MAFTHTPFELVVAEQPVRDHAAQALQGLVGALLGDQRDELADLRVVDRVLQRVGRGRVGLADVQPQVEHQALADLALGLAHTVVGVQREPRDLDRDRLGTAVWVVAILVEIVLVFVLVIVTAGRVLITGLQGVIPLSRAFG